MSIWAGWQQDLLDAANISGNEATNEFLSDWNGNATSSCANNPVDISRAETGAANCRKLTKTRTAKKYTSHAQGAKAFGGQINSGNFPHLLGAIKNPTPYQNPNPAQVADDLRAWGSAKFATYYLAHSNVGSGSGDGGSSGASPRIHNAYHDLQQSTAKNLPAALNASHRNTSAALRSLSKARKVRL